MGTTFFSLERMFLKCNCSVYIKKQSIFKHRSLYLVTKEVEIDIDLVKYIQTS